MSVSSMFSEARAGVLLKLKNISSNEFDQIYTSGYYFFSAWKRWSCKILSHLYLAFQTK